MVLQALLARFLSGRPTLARRFRNALPSRRGHGATLWGAGGVLASRRSTVALTTGFDTTEGLDRSVESAALLFKLLDNLVKVHGTILTLGLFDSHCPSPIS